MGGRGVSELHLRRKREVREGKRVSGLSFCRRTPSFSHRTRRHVQVLRELLDGGALADGLQREEKVSLADDFGFARAAAASWGCIVAERACGRKTRKRIFCSLPAYATMDERDRFSPPEPLESPEVR
jgi:hypothetical protein